MRSICAYVYTYSKCTSTRTTNSIMRCWLSWCESSSSSLSLSPLSLGTLLDTFCRRGCPVAIAIVVAAVVVLCWQEYGRRIVVGSAPAINTTCLPTYRTTTQQQTRVRVFMHVGLFSQLWWHSRTSNAVAQMRPHATHGWEKRRETARDSVLRHACSCRRCMCKCIACNCVGLLKYSYGCSRQECPLQVEPELELQRRGGV